MNKAPLPQIPDEKAPFSLPALTTQQQSEARDWARLAILSLAFSGLAPLLLIAGRASVYAEMAAVKAWFVPMLVIHVNLSVGLWFLACLGVVSRMLAGYAHPCRRMMHGFAAFSFLGAVLCIALGPLAGGDAYTSNYIPVQNNGVFFLGLGLAASSLLIMLADGLYSIRGADVLSLGVKTALIALLVALGCFMLSVLQHPDGYGGEPFYEAVFWGGGHILQFVYVLLSLLAWLWLAGAAGISFFRHHWLKGIFLALGLAVAVSPLIYLFSDVNSYAHIMFFTWQMNSVTGPFSGIVALFLLVALLRKGRLGLQTPATLALWMSVILFLFGGALGYVIEGSNVTIPAHYHGSTVGVTLALMGLFYLLVPRLTGREMNGRMAKAQPVLYGVGQLMHVTGLAWAGGHDIARKTAGALTADQMGAEAALQVMRFGGLLAVLGGGIFVVLMLRAFYRRSLTSNAQLS